MSELNLQVGDVVQLIETGNFSSRLRAGDTLEVIEVDPSLTTSHKFKVLSCSKDPSFEGGIQYGRLPWLGYCVIKLPKLKEIPHDTTTPLKVGDYVEVIYEDSLERGAIKKVIDFREPGHIRTLSNVGKFAGTPIWYTRREYLSLIKWYK